MIPLTESIDIMFDKWFNDLKCGNVNNEDVLAQIEYERVILNKVCCVAEDLKYYSIVDKKSYFSIQDTVLDCFKRLNAIEYVWKDEQRIYKYLNDYKIGD